MTSCFYNNNRKYHYLLLIILFRFVLLPAQSNGGITLGSVLFCDSVNSGFISLSNYVGTIVFWEYSDNSGSSWNSVTNNTSTQGYTNLKVSRWFRAIVKDGNFPQDTSSVSTVSVYAHGNTGSMTGGGRFCAISGNGILSVNGFNGTVIKWESTTNNWTTVNQITNNTYSLTYSGVNASTFYRAIVNANGSCPNDTTKIASILIDQNTNPGTLSKNDSVCSNVNIDTLRLGSHTGEIIDWGIRKINEQSWTYINDTSEFRIYEGLNLTTYYKIRIKNGVCPLDSTNEVQIKVFDMPAVDAGPDKYIVRKQTITLEAHASGNISWTPTENVSNPNSAAPSVNPLVTTVYTLYVTDAHGCNYNDTVTVYVENPIPNVITPNNDGVNDLLVIDKLEDYPNNSLQIYNKWGERIFFANPYKNDWGGKSKTGSNLPDDTYQYVFDYGDGRKLVSDYLVIIR